MGEGGIAVLANCRFKIIEIFIELFWEKPAKKPCLGQGFYTYSLSFSSGKAF